MRHKYLKQLKNFIKNNHSIKYDILINDLTILFLHISDNKLELVTMSKTNKLNILYEYHLGDDFLEKLSYILLGDIINEIDIGKIYKKRLTITDNDYLDIITFKYDYLIINNNFKNYREFPIILDFKNVISIDKSFVKIVFVPLSLGYNNLKAFYEIFQFKNLTDEHKDIIECELSNNRKAI